MEKAIREEAKALKILVVDDEENMLHMLSAILRREGYSVTTALSGQKGLEAMETEPFDFVLADIRMPGMDGMALLDEIQKLGHDTTVIMMSAYGSVDIALEAVKRGAYDYISKPFKSGEVALALKKALERERLRRENIRLRRTVEKEFGLEGMIARSPGLRGVVQAIRRVADLRTTVLIQGESGTGKELVARAIHQNGVRKDRPFVAVNCGAIPENLLESELFGHTKGAFTDARSARKGLFEEAHGGTLLLDEVGELPLNLQVKLLRVLQEGEIRLVGGVKTTPIDVRVVASTIRDLALEVKEGRFREDLFFRLNVFPIQVPPLRERPDDIPPLVEHFVDKCRRQVGKDVVGVEPRAMERLLRYPWPGNVRELENVIERAIIMADSERIREEDLLIERRRSIRVPLSMALGEELSVKRVGRMVEADLIRRALDRTDGNRTRAARLLEMSHPSLLAKMKQYGIQ
ncbi:MAG: sigma-54-dependent Fis family transcriptional regulator [Deltaproteobacteria bacterium]|nr:sigma-54-dependent Fis family transcriptional regulator [Deltaproteobacteria bacterium]